MRVQFIWHLHQPYYGLPNRPVHHLPWVRLHATRSYYDMARALQSHPDIKATVNFSGCLLRQFREVLDDGHRDTWWDLSIKPASSLDEHDKRHLLRHFFSLDPEREIRPHPRYGELLARRDRADGFDSASFRDLQVWFNLAWFGSYAREERPIVQELIDKGRGFTEPEKEALLEQQLDVMHQIIPLYRELHRRGQVELSVTPMYHPILPVVIDSDAALSQSSDGEGPQRFLARGDAGEHVWAARSIAREVLGVDVDGMWPAEGAVSHQAYTVFAEQEVRWIATGHSALDQSLPATQSARRADVPYRVGPNGPAVFFRHRELSERIAHRYADEDPQSAARDLIAELKASSGVVTLIVDGQRVWRRYADSGRPFLEALYRGIAEAPDLECTTPSRFLDEVGCADELTALGSGTWFGADFDRWIGTEPANRAWDALHETRQDMVRRLKTHAVDPEVEEAVWDALLIAQGSDWFARYGRESDSENDRDHDRLFRDHLRFVYETLGMPVPDFVDTPIGAAVGIEFEAPQRLISPRIDGATDSYYEWEGAGRYDGVASRGSMFQSQRVVDTIFVGFDLEHLFIRVDWTRAAARADHEVDVVMIVEQSQGVFVAALRPGGMIRWRHDDSEIPLFEIALGASLEAALAWTDIELAASEPFRLRFEVRIGSAIRERHPPHGALDLTVPDTSFDARNWIV